MSGDESERREAIGVTAAGELREAGEALRRWYREHRRELPWRGLEDPYAILVSEVMLQQTQVARAAPYFERFVERFPTIGALADAEADEVVATWSGLGYYERARRLHRAARQLAAADRVPCRAAELEELPGVGPYTAAAVASIAFGEAVPAIDANARRVLARLVALEADPRRAKSRRRLRRLAVALLDEEEPGTSNQALMELGARVCTPDEPDCAACPLSPWCAAAAHGEPERYPPPVERSREPVRIEALAVLVRDADRVLLARRRHGAGYLAGTWEVPWIECGGGAPAARLGDRYGGEWDLRDRLGTVRHSITFRRFVVDVHAGAWSAGRGDEDGGRRLGWFDRAGRADVPTSSLVDKILVL